MTTVRKNHIVPAYVSQSETSVAKCPIAEHIIEKALFNSFYSSLVCDN